MPSVVDTGRIWLLSSAAVRLTREFVIDGGITSESSLYQAGTLKLNASLAVATGKFKREKLVVIAGARKTPEMSSGCDPACSWPELIIITVSKQLKSHG